MSTVWFENSSGDLREIGICNSNIELNIIIKKFLDDHNYKSYYTQTTKLPDGKYKLDVGSWSEFFITDLDLSDRFSEE